jgi:AsmA-like C-terminal region
MSSATALPPSSNSQARPRGRRKLSRKTILFIVLAAAALLAVVLVTSGLWPFSPAPVLQNLGEASDSQLQVRAFHRTYFPFPGCIVEGLVFNHDPSEPAPLLAIDKLTIRGTYLGLLTRRVSRITADGMHVVIPAFGTSKPFHTTPSKITIDQIVANGAIIEFDFHNPEKPRLRFDVHEASLQNVGWKGPLTYRLKVHNPEPPGEISAEGKFGVWDTSNPSQTPISGEYTFEHADLSVYHGIAGMLASQGQFSGTLGHIDISGKTDTPDFEVRMGGHPMRLTTEFTAYVDATHGDTFLKRVDADFWKTHIIAEGSIAGTPGGKGKTALIDLRSSGARIEDLLRLFVKANRAPMSGKVALQARAEIPPGEEEFLKKLKLRGNFGIAGGTFSKSSTQEGVNKLSAGARGEKDVPDAETVVTDLTGQVNLQDGISSFSDLSFGVPGADARMHGTYNLLNKKIDLRGQLRVDSKMSNTETGTKAFLLKMMEPFFKKKNRGEIVPVRISGTYGHPTFGLSLNDKQAQNVPAPQSSPSKTKPGADKPRQ